MSRDFGNHIHCKISLIFLFARCPNLTINVFNFMALRFGGQAVQSVVRPKIVVFGVGGGGSNAINHMIESNVKGVDFVVANTDAQALEYSVCENKIQLGATITGGLGAGSVPEIGRRAAEESMSMIEDYLRDANMVFIACGMGGGTGTGAAPVIAKLSKERGILTIGVVTKPFAFEREKRMRVAQEGITEIRKFCDTTIVISNQNLFRVANADTTLQEAFKMADNVLVSGIRCITDLITNSGLVNLDFADVSVIMSDMGYAVMGEGIGTGEDRANRAAENAMTNPLLEESSIKGATGLLINISGGSDITLFEINDIIDRITAEVDPEANIKFGSIINEEFAGMIKVSIVATGLTHLTNGLKPKHTPYEEPVHTIEHRDVISERSHKHETINHAKDSNEIDGQFADDDEMQSGFGGYDIPEQEESDEDYFKSYNERTGHTINNMLFQSQQKKTHDSFVPKRSVDIQNAAETQQQGKSDRFIKNIFKINRGS